MTAAFSKGLFAAAALLAFAGSAWAAPPGPAPTAGRGGPPPAWVAVGKAERWLAYSGWCWKGRCVRPRNPITRTDIPRVRATVGSIARIHFGFAAHDVSVSRAGGRSTQSLAPGRMTAWRVPQKGTFVITAGATGTNTVSYALTIG